MVNAHRKALERMWQDRCSVFIKSKITDPATRLTGFQEMPLFENQPCKLSFESYGASSGSPAAAVSQSVKLFLSPSLAIPAGSKIMVSRGANTFVYKSSGEPAVFHNHQEINLEIFERWA
jgi:hypothetical protein